MCQRWVIVLVTRDSTMTPTLRLCAGAPNQCANFVYGVIIPCQTGLPVARGMKCSGNAAAPAVIRHGSAMVSPFCSTMVIIQCYRRVDELCSVGARHAVPPYLAPLSGSASFRCSRFEITGATEIPLPHQWKRDYVDTVDNEQPNESSSAQSAYSVQYREALPSPDRG